MSFSTAQSADFFPLRDAAWREAARQLNRDPKDAAARDEWYRETLERELGVTTSKDLCSRNDYCNAMAVMENIARGSHEKKFIARRCVRTFIPGRIYWNLRATEDENSRRLIHAINNCRRSLGLAEEYPRGIARQMFQTDGLPLLTELKPDQLRQVLVALRKHVTKAVNAEAAAMEGGSPF